MSKILIEIYTMIFNCAAGNMTERMCACGWVTHPHAHSSVRAGTLECNTPECVSWLPRAEETDEATMCNLQLLLKQQRASQKHWEDFSWTENTLQYT